MADQFWRLRAGDPDWYENVYGADKIAELHELTLSDIIKRNTNVQDIDVTAMIATDNYAYV